MIKFHKSPSIHILSLLLLCMVAIMGGTNDKYFVDQLEVNMDDYLHLYCMWFHLFTWNFAWWISSVFYILRQKHMTNFHNEVHQQQSWRGHKLKIVQISLQIHMQTAEPASARDQTKSGLIDRRIPVFEGSRHKTQYSSISNRIWYPRIST